MEDVKVREMQIFDYKKKIAEAETKLKQQQNLYEAVRSDRNLYSKNLIESQVSVGFSLPSATKLRRFFFFLHLSVCPHRGKGSASVHAGIPSPQEQAPPGADTPPPSRHPPPPSRQLLLRTVRILLECILVSGVFLRYMERRLLIPKKISQLWINTFALSYIRVYSMTNCDFFY